MHPDSLSLHGTWADTRGVAHVELWALRAGHEGCHVFAGTHVLRLRHPPCELARVSGYESRSRPPALL